MTTDRKRTLGAYYTPEVLCDFLCRWAIQNQHDNILEPSFGNGNILDAAHSILEELGSLNPRRHIYGCDIDGIACATVVKKGYIKSHLINKDFLSTTPTDFAPNGFETIIANPPYVSVRGISKHQQSKGKEIAGEWNFAIDGKSSLWAYFILHSLNFLKENGRMAWVLPKNFLYADYARALQTFLIRHFEKIEIHNIEESLFIQEGTTERVVILLCTNFSKTPTTTTSIPSSKFYHTLEEFTRNAGAIRQDNLPNYIQPTIAHIAKLGDLAEINIGIVTGASKYVIFSAKEAEELNIKPEYLLPIFTKSSNYNTLLLETNVLEKPSSRNSKTKILDISKWRTDNYQEFKEFYDNIPHDVRHNTAANGKEIWYSIANSTRNNNVACDAFLVPLTQNFPRLIINKAKVDCTNSLYRVFFKTPQLFSQHDKTYLTALVCLSFYNSFTRLSISQNARLHGKALKLEPSNFKRINIYLLNTSAESLTRVLITVNSMIESKKDDEAIVKLVDDFFTEKSNGDYQTAAYSEQLIEAMKNYGR